MTKPPLHYLTATEAVTRFREGSLSPVTLVEAVLERAAETEQIVNALPLRYAEAAVAAAKDAEARYAGQGAPPRPLEGLPVAFKDSTDVAGQPTSMGSLIPSEQPAPSSSPLNARLLRAGAIAHARSTTPEFSCAYVTHSRKWGVTRNPWNPAYTPGGSSGGAAAALAAGSAVLATGSDIAGSIRLPAACCGVVGFKPSRGRIPVDPPFNLDPYCHAGPMARCVADVILLYNAMSGPHALDPATFGTRQRVADRPLDLNGVTVGYSLDLGGFAVDDTMRENTLRAAERFTSLGARLVERDPGWAPEIVEAAQAHLRHIFGTWVARLSAENPELLSSYARHFADSSRTTSASAYLDALTVLSRMQARFAEIMTECRFFLLPTTAVPAVAADFDPSRDSLSIAGQPVDPMLGWGLTVPFNMLGHHPVLSVPTGHSSDGVPTGMQIVGRARRDADVLRAGVSYEAVTGMWYRDTLRSPAPGNWALP